MSKLIQISTIVLACLFVAIPVRVSALSCADDATQVARAEAVFSAIPMKGEILVDQDMAVFTVDVYRVWKGHVQVQETVAVTLQRAFILGEEVVLATNRDDAGRFFIGQCMLARDTWREPDWVDNTLGAPEFEFTPTLLNRPIPD